MNAETREPTRAPVEEDHRAQAHLAFEALGAVVHKLGTPLGTIRSCAYLLRAAPRAPERAEQREWLRGIEASCETAARILDATRELCSWHAASLSFERVDLRRWVREHLVRPTDEVSSRVDVHEPDGGGGRADILADPRALEAAAGALRALWTGLAAPGPSPSRVVLGTEADSAEVVLHASLQPADPEPVVQTAGAALRPFARASSDDDPLGLALHASVLALVLARHGGWVRTSRDGTTVAWALHFPAAIGT